MKCARFENVMTLIIDQKVSFRRSIRVRCRWHTSTLVALQLVVHARFLGASPGVSYRANTELIHLAECG